MQPVAVADVVIHRRITAWQAYQRKLATVTLQRCTTSTYTTNAVTFTDTLVTPDPQNEKKADAQVRCQIEKKVGCPAEAAVVFSTRKMRIPAKSTVGRAAAHTVGSEAETRAIDGSAGSIVDKVTIHTVSSRVGSIPESIVVKTTGTEGSKAAAIVADRAAG